jgi:hypothetical protein
MLTVDKTKATENMIVGRGFFSVSTQKEEDEPENSRDDSKQTSFSQQIEPHWFT